MVTNGDNSNIGANSDNNDPLETMIIHKSYNGAHRNNNANRDNGAYGKNSKSL